MANKSIATYSIISPDKTSPAVIKPSHEGNRSPSLRLFASAFCVLSLLAISVAFWTLSSKKPILFSLELGIWFHANPKYATYLWTGLGTICSFLTLFFIGEILSVATGQLIVEHGATISTIEGILVLALRSVLTFLFSWSRWAMSLFTLLAGIVAMSLTTTYTGLITPTNVVTRDSTIGTEIDFASPKFWSWYNTFDISGDPVRKISGCTWYKYESPSGTVTFNTCPMASDTESFVSAGVSAAQIANGINSTTRVVNTLYSGSTGGTLPLGWRGVVAFDNIELQIPEGVSLETNFNYSLIQQGLTAEVSCQKVTSNPILRYINETITVTNAGSSGEVYLQTFVLNPSKDSGCFPPKKVSVTSTQASIACFGCQPDPKSKKYLLYVTPVDNYAKPDPNSGDQPFPNLQCLITPKLTTNNVTYSSITGLFTSTLLNITSDTSLVPNETAESISYLFDFAATSWGNLPIDALYAAERISTSPVPVTQAFEAMIRGMIEYEATQLRMYYSANLAPGVRNITGTLTTSRVGYYGQTATLYTLGPVFSIIALLCSIYLVLALRTGLPYKGAFDPMDTTCLIAAGAAAATKGMLVVGADGGHEGDRKALLSTRVMYEEGQGLVTSHTPPARGVTGD